MADILHRFGLWLSTSGLFWVAVFIAATFKAATSDVVGWRTVLASFAAAILGAIAFTDPVLHWLDLPDDPYRIAVGVALALTFEHIARGTGKLLSDPAFFRDLAARILGVRNEDDR